MSSSISNKILAWYKKHKRDLPWRSYQNQSDRHYKVLLSEFMLQQTQVKTVIPYFNNFYKKIPRIDLLAKTRLDRINKLWQGLGYYRRAKNLLQTAQIISDKYNSRLPSTYDKLINLPGIGDYTAKAILSIAFDKSEIGIDGNVKRVFSRLHNIKDNKKILIKLNEIKVKKNSSSLMQGIMELGALICRPKKPLCDQCCLNFTCKFFNGLKKDSKKKSLTKIKVRKFYELIYIVKKKILLNFETKFGPLNGFLNVPLLEVSEKKLKNNITALFSKKFTFSVNHKINIFISNFKADITLIEIKPSDLTKIKLNQFKFYSNDQLKKEFVSSFLKKILSKIKFL